MNGKGAEIALVIKDDDFIYPKMAISCGHRLVW